MPSLTAVVPATITTMLKDAVATGNASVDSVVTAALSMYFRTARHRAYQISTSAALVQGVYDGAVSSQILLANGDFGLGTFENLDGEMIVLDGNIYQVRGDGKVQLRTDDFRVPFAVVSHYQPDKSFDVRAAGSLKALEQACDSHRESDNLFYALRADGFFERMHTRAVKPVSPGTRLVAAAEAEPQFHFAGVEGTLICIWSPRYSGSFNIPGYHFHFLSKDRTKGGHVLDCSAQALHFGIQMLSDYDVRLPESGSFLNANLAIDTTRDLQSAE